MSRAHLVAQYEAWRVKCPEAYPLFVHFAREIRAAGHTHYSAAQIVGRIRYETDLRRAPDERFKINQNYAKCLGEELIHDDPSFAGFFRTRRPNR